MHIDLAQMRQWRNARRPQPGIGDRKRQAEIGREPHVPPLAIDFPVGVEMLELVGEFARALAGPEKKDPAGLQTEVEQRHRFLLGRRLEIDHQVAATDQVQFRERRRP